MTSGGPVSVDYGDGAFESAGFRERPRVKLFAKTGEGNKPHHPTPYNLLQTLF